METIENMLWTWVTEQFVAIEPGFVLLLSKIVLLRGGFIKATYYKKKSFFEAKV